MFIFNLGVAVLGLTVTEVVAFPSLSVEFAQQQLQKIQKEQKRSLEKENRKRMVPFDAASQYVSTSGEYAFVAPNFAAGDVRGPCPGLNAAANHGYINHSGIADITTIISGVNTAYGMALDLGGFLAVYGAVYDGNLLGYSIGGPTTASQLPLNNIVGLAGSPQGLSGSHNKCEADASPSRGDLYLNGNNYIVQVDQFEQYYNALVENEDAQTQFDNLLDFHKARWEHSEANNPYFFFPPFAGILVTPAGYAFPPRMMSNKSSEFPTGTLSRANLMSFFSITGTPGKFKYTIGHERIPNNFYKLNVADEYTIPGFLADVVDHGLKYPNLLSIGGNTGKVNTFTPVEVGNLTGGVYNSATLLEGNNLECFLFQVSLAAVPDVAGGSLTTYSGGDNSALTALVQQNIGSLACPTLNALDNAQFSKYPGYTTCKDGCGGYA